LGLTELSYRKLVLKNSMKDYYFTSFKQKKALFSERWNLVFRKGGWFWCKNCRM